MNIPNWLENFMTISPWSLNLFSFVLGMFYTLANISTWGNPRRLWSQVVLYTALVAVYYYLKSEFGR